MACGDYDGLSNVCLKTISGIEIDISQLLLREIAPKGYTSSSLGYREAQKKANHE
jgi:hypothetical protein